MADAELSGDIVKVDPDQRRFYGWAYSWRDSDGQVSDHSGDVIDNDEAVAKAEDAFYRYVIDSRQGDDQHETFGASSLIEMVVLTKDKADMMGVDTGGREGVWVGFQANDTDDGDRLWESIKNRDKTSFSIVGSGTRKEL